MEKIVLALGFFDGIHRGHAALLNKTKERATALQLTPAVLTFDAHPRKILTGLPTPLITSPEDRAEVLHRLFAIDKLCVCHVDKDFLKLSPEDFVEKVVVKQFHAAHVVAGHDFHFGYQNTGNPESLREYCDAYGIGCDIIPCIYENDKRISSSIIRFHLGQGDMLTVNKLLGHPYGFSGVVIHGQRLGSKIGIPTCNVTLPEDTIPPFFGVYTTKVYLPDGREYKAVCNIGKRPSVNGKGILCECHLFGFDEPIYDQKVRIEFYTLLRDERKFSSVEELKAQELIDIASAKKYWNIP